MHRLVTSTWRARRGRRREAQRAFMAPARPASGGGTRGQDGWNPTLDLARVRLPSCTAPGPASPARRSRTRSCCPLVGHRPSDQVNPPGGGPGAQVPVGRQVLLPDRMRTADHRDAELRKNEATEVIEVRAWRAAGRQAGSHVRDGRPVLLRRLPSGAYPTLPAGHAAQAACPTNSTSSPRHAMNAPSRRRSAQARAASAGSVAIADDDPDPNLLAHCRLHHDDSLPVSDRSQKPGAAAGATALELPFRLTARCR